MDWIAKRLAITTRGGGVLGLLEGVVDTQLAGKCRRAELADSGAQPLELGDGDELHADIGHSLDGRMRRVDRVGVRKRFVECLDNLTALRPGICNTRARKSTCSIRAFLIASGPKRTL
jgi:hypothetical protein